MPTIADVRRIAGTLPDVSERPHFDRIALRARITFATIDPETASLNLRIDPPERQTLLLETRPDVFGPCGGWTKMGWTSVTLSRIDRALLEELLLDAWREAATKRGLAEYDGAAPAAKKRTTKKPAAKKRAGKKRTAERGRR